jgi:alpha-tubulin suppressor-like RCC1 family protein
MMDLSPSWSSLSLRCFFVRADGTLHSWGHNYSSALGLNSDKKLQSIVWEPQEVSLKTDEAVANLLPRGAYDLVSLACGDSHSLALTRSGKVSHWDLGGLKEGQGLKEDERGEEGEVEKNGN